MNKSGLTLQRLADKARIDPDPLYKLRSNRNPPSANVLVAISTALGLDLEKLKKLRALLPSYTYTRNEYKRKYKEKHGVPYDKHRLGKLPQNKVVQENKKKIDKRLCLCCGKLFTSEGPHNRICGRCKAPTRGGEIKFDRPVHRMPNHVGRYVSMAQ